MEQSNTQKTEVSKVEYSVKKVDLKDVPETRAQQMNAIYLPIFSFYNEKETELKALLGKPVDKENYLAVSTLRKLLKSTRTENIKKFTPFEQSAKRELDATKSVGVNVNFLSKEIEGKAEAREKEYLEQEQKRKDQILEDRIQALKEVGETIIPEGLSKLCKSAFITLVANTRTRIEAEQKVLLALQKRNDEEKRLSDLKITRIEICRHVYHLIDQNIVLEELSLEEFNTCLKSAELKKEALDEQVLNLKKEQDKHNERIRRILPFMSFIDPNKDNTDFKEMSDVDFEDLLIAVTQLKKDHDKKEQDDRNHFKALKEAEDKRLKEEQDKKDKIEADRVAKELQIEKDKDEEFKNQQREFKKIESPLFLKMLEDIEKIAKIYTFGNHNFSNIKGELENLVSESKTIIEDV